MGPELIRSCLYDKLRDAQKEEVDRLMAEAPQGRPQARGAGVRVHAAMGMHAGVRVKAGMGVYAGVREQPWACVYAPARVQPG